MKLQLFFTLAAAIASPMSMWGQKVAGPDGRLVVDVTENNGKPYYSVSYDSKPFVLDSPLGLKMNLGDMSSGLVLTGASEVEKVSDTYSIPNLKQSNVSFDANKRVYSFTKNGKKIFDVEFVVSDNDVAFRYLLAPQGDTKVAVVDQEVSSFILPEYTTTFLCPQMLPMTGFARTAPSYETSYVADGIMGTNGWGDGFVFPALFKVGDNGWMLISETGVDGAYCASHIVNNGQNVYQVALP